MRVVLDSSALVVAAFADSGLAYLDGHELLAPPLVRSEAMSVIHEALWRREIPRDVAVVARDAVLDAKVELVSGRALYTAAWDVAERFGFAKTYDAIYVALAKRRDIPLLTVDGRLRRTVGSYIEVIGFDQL